MAVGLGLEANVKLNSDLSVNTGPYRNIVKQSSRSKPLNDFKAFSCVDQTSMVDITTGYTLT